MFSKWLVTPLTCPSVTICYCISLVPWFPFCNFVHHKLFWHVLYKFVPTRLVNNLGKFTVTDNFIISLSLSYIYFAVNSSSVFSRESNVLSKFLSFQIHSSERPVISVNYLVKFTATTPTSNVNLKVISKYVGLTYHVSVCRNMRSMFSFRATLSQPSPPVSSRVWGRDPLHRRPTPGDTQYLQPSSGRELSSREWKERRAHQTSDRYSGRLHGWGHRRPTPRYTQQQQQHQRQQLLLHFQRQREDGLDWQMGSGWGS